MTRPRYGWPCPTCSSPANEHCRSLTTHRVTDTHVARCRVAPLILNGVPMGLAEFKGKMKEIGGLVGRLRSEFST